MSRHHRRLHEDRWQRTRGEVFERDGWRCVKCGKAGRLEADHVVPLHVDPAQDPYAVAGCQTLCWRCHIDKTAGENSRPDPARERWRALIAERMSETL